MRNPLTHGDKVSVDHRVTVNPAQLSDDELLAIAAGGRVIDGEAEELAEDDERLTLPE